MSWNTWTYSNGSSWSIPPEPIAEKHEEQNLKRKARNVISGTLDGEKLLAGRSPMRRMNQNWGSDSDSDNDLEDSPNHETREHEIDTINPSIGDFRNYIRKLNPLLLTSNEYLVDRISHQMVARYESLLGKKRDLLTRIRDQESPFEELSIVSSQPENDPDQGRSVAVSTILFPDGIPVPPVSALPATFECPICFGVQKVIKPSDWTKHVHHDVQPFTCTWDHCREPKMYGRKADWVRHENEDHRHLEWWTCDIDECKHTCYKRENFLQHLVREHKFSELKVKTKAKFQMSDVKDPIWQKIEKCHIETTKRPQEEPCSFCGETFSTWKKLTVHVGQHMEMITLPILRLVHVRNPQKEGVIESLLGPMYSGTDADSQTLPHSAKIQVASKPHETLINDWALLLLGSASKPKESLLERSARPHSLSGSEPHPMRIEEKNTNATALGISGQTEVDILSEVSVSSAFTLQQQPKYKFNLEILLNHGKQNNGLDKSVHRAKVVMDEPEEKIEPVVNPEKVADGGNPTHGFPVVMDDTQMEIENHTEIGIQVHLKSESLEPMNKIPRSSRGSLEEAEIAPSPSAECPGSSQVSTPYSTESSQGSGVLRSATHVRRAGLVRIRIEQLSIFDRCPADAELTEEDVDYQLEDSEYEQDYETADSEQNALPDEDNGELSSSCLKEQCSSTRQANPSAGSRDGGGDEGDKEQRKRPRGKRKMTSCPERLVRYACPYQAWNAFAFQNCRIENACRSVPDDEAWWNLFRLLIPNMYGRDTQSLSPPYQPSSHEEHVVHNSNSDFPNLLAQEDFFHNDTSATFTDQPATSQSLSLPLYEVLNDREGGDSDYLSFLSAAGTSTAAQPNATSVDSSSSSNNLLPSLIPTPTPDVAALSEPSSSNQISLRRNHERLRERNSRTVEDNARLRRAAHATLEDLDHVDTLIEELLDSENTTDIMYGKLSRISTLLLSAKRKLQ
ncbi:hypothetical protein G7054_g3429 [Neopestalotiopsis clavispora]|nr:hypothetical protein G7054_g3429 [Neopestalotiopsis clavispora]